MPNRVKISTKTTRNEEFNRYEKDGVLNSVTSMNTTREIPNIKLLDVNEAVVKQGSVIATDAINNTTLIEISLQVNHETALRLYQYSIGNIPDPETNPKGYQEYLYYYNALAQIGMSYDNIKAWISDYDETTVLNSSDPNNKIYFNPDAKYQIFGAPDQVVLNNRQHFNNCGIESTLNNLAMAGIVKMDENLKDQEQVEKSFLQDVLDRNLAYDSKEVGVLDQGDGGTRPDDYRDIMEYFGIDSKSYYITVKSNEFVYPKAKINEMAYKISQGYGAVLGVCSSILWNEAQSETGKKQIDHAIAITGVVYEENVNPAETDNEGNYINSPVGFYIHDTGGWMTKFISYDELINSTLCDYVYGDEDTETTLSSLKEYDSRLDYTITKDEQGIFITLTNAPIKVNPFKLNATGDKFDNILIGNNSENVIKGMNGNDVLYGRGGRDEIYGGYGNDVIVGNEAYTLKVKSGEEVLYESHTVNDFKEYLERSGVLSEVVENQLAKVEVRDYGDLTVEQFFNLEDIMPKGINTLYGEAGNDIIIGGEYADLIYGDKGNDYVWGGFGRNAIYGGAGDDVIIGGYDNDRLFGDAGNDIIYGLGDDDVIDGGAGNDHLAGGRGSDTIETGAGNDTVYFEGTDFGVDQVMSKSGNTLLKFVEDGDTDTDASAVSDFFFSLGLEQEDDKAAHLVLQYKQEEISDDESAIRFADFMTLKSAKTKTVYLESDTDGLYTVSVSNKANATVANTKERGTTKIFNEKINNSDINNVLLTSYDGATIKTSTKNDIVTMLSNDTPLISTKIDKITYTGGADKYVSEDRNTYYSSGAITNDTNLSIYDNVVGLTKNIFDEGEYIAAALLNPEVDITEFIEEDTNYTSKDDRLYLGADRVNFLFDVSLDADNNAITTEHSGLYLFDVDIYKPSTYVSDVANIVNGIADGGFIYMDSFFEFDEEEETQITGDDFYGNGQIEKLYLNGINHDYNGDLTSIASDVATWLNTNGYTSAFDAFETAEGEELEALIACYTGTPAQNIA